MAGYRNPIVGGIMSLLGSKNTTSSPVIEEKKKQGGMLDKAKEGMQNRTKKIDNAVKKAGG